MEKVKLGDVSKLINGDRGKNYPSQADITEDGEVPFVNAGHLNGRNIDFEEMNYISQDKYDRLSSGKFQKGDILYCLRGSLGKKAIVSNDVNGAIASSLVIIRPDMEKVSGEYLMLALDSPAIKEQLVKANNGSSQPNLSAASVREYEVELPELSVQKEVVERLCKVRNILDSRRQELQLLDDLIKARFVEMFGNPEQNEKGWRTCRLGDECTVINGRAYKAEELLDEGKYRVLRVGNFFTNDSWYYSDLELDNDKYCDEGDLLFAWSASFGPRIWHGEKVIYHYHIWKLIGYENCLNKDFFVELLNYNCDVMKRGTHGSTMLHFTKSQMEDQLLILPPMQLQEQFADFVHQVDKSKAAVKNALDQTKLLFDSLMQQYFG